MMRKIKNAILGTLSIFFCLACSNAQSKDKSVGVKEMNASEIIRLIDKGKNVSIVNAIIYDDLDFTTVEDMSVTAPNEVVVNVPVHIYFQGCVFMGRVTTCEDLMKDGKPTGLRKKVHFKGEVCFFDCDFRKELKFDESEVDGNINFTKTVFNEVSSFNHILVNGTQSQFVNINANKKFMFVYNTIRGNVTFMDAQFKESVNFSGLDIRDLIFNNVKTQGRLDISESTLHGIFQYNYGECGGDASFAFSKFLDRVSINDTKFEGEVSLERSHFFGKVKMNRSSFDKLVVTDALFFEEPEMKEVVKKDEDPIVVEVKQTSTVQINQ